LLDGVVLYRSAMRCSRGSIDLTSFVATGAPMTGRRTDAKRRTLRACMVSIKEIDATGRVWQRWMVVCWFDQARVYCKLDGMPVVVLQSIWVQTWDSLMHLSVVLDPKYHPSTGHHTTSSSPLSFHGASARCSFTLITAFEATDAVQRAGKSTHNACIMRSRAFIGKIEA
jgi:hypothetical protein